MVQPDGEPGQPDPDLRIYTPLEQTPEEIANGEERLWLSQPFDWSYRDEIDVEVIPESKLPDGIRPEGDRPVSRN